MGGWGAEGGVSSQQWAAGWGISGCPSIKSEEDSRLGKHLSSQSGQKLENQSGLETILLFLGKVRRPSCVIIIIFSWLA